MVFSSTKVMIGGRLLNWLINHLPFEIHLPGYNYCGPGTNLIERLARGDKGINQLDEYCKEHDIAYSRSLSLKDRLKADIRLMKMARKRIQAPDAGIGEKIAAQLVNKAMLAKVKLGSGNIKPNTKRTGLKKHFKKVISHTKTYLKKLKPKGKKLAIELAIAAAKEMTANTDVKLPRVISIPKTGGVLPLIPIFAGLSATGSLAGGVAGIVKTINEYKDAKKRLEELKRHNEKLEALCIGKGLHIKPHKNGLGLFISNKKIKTKSTAT